jgi:formate hydrogenlyase transcriptional activator
MDALRNHDWPGNIRELQNFVERAVIMTTGPVLRPGMTELTRDYAGAGPVRTLADAERAHIAAVLRETNWVVGGQSGAAARLGVPRTTLISRMRKLGITRLTSGRWVDQASSGVANGNSSASERQVASAAC